MPTETPKCHPLSCSGLLLVAPSPETALNHSESNATSRGYTGWRTAIQCARRRSLLMVPRTQKTALHGYFPSHAETHGNPQSHSSRTLLFHELSLVVASVCSNFRIALGVLSSSSVDIRLKLALSRSYRRSRRSQLLRPRLLLPLLYIRKHTCRRCRTVLLAHLQEPPNIWSA